MTPMNRVCISAAFGILALAASSFIASDGEAYAAADERKAKSEAPAGKDPLATATPQMKAVMDALKSLGPKPIEKLTPAEALRRPTR